MACNYNFLLNPFVEIIGRLDPWRGGSSSQFGLLFNTCICCGSGGSGGSPRSLKLGPYRKSRSGVLFVSFLKDGDNVVIGEGWILGSLWCSLSVEHERAHLLNAIVERRGGLLVDGRGECLGDNLRAFVGAGFDSGNHDIAGRAGVLGVVCCELLEGRRHDVARSIEVGFEVGALARVVEVLDERSKRDHGGPGAAVEVVLERDGDGRVELLLGEAVKERRAQRHLLGRGRCWAGKDAATQQVHQVAAQVRGRLCR
mmetsp:Transcript_13674/g.18775  ORF Transcript_13674/g.18775 Transcript_13674/m.18775 type:complete len:256 (-) Transcript_13674:528-1295(-)